VSGRRRAGRGRMLDTQLKLGARPVSQGAVITNWTEVLSAISTAVGAVASIALVVAALLFREDILLERRRPILSLSHDSHSHDAILFNDPDSNYWLCVRVSNRFGRDLARRVQLSLIRVDSLRDTPPLESPVPSRPFLVYDLELPHIDIPANVSYRYTVAFVEAARSSGAEIRVEPRSTVGRDILPPGSYQLILVLTGDNADASYWTTDLHFSDSPHGYTDLPNQLRLTAPRQLPGPP